MPIISTSLASAWQVQHFMFPSNGKLSWKVLAWYIPFSNHCSHKTLPVLSEHWGVPVFANRGCETWTNMVLCIAWGITIVGSRLKRKRKRKIMLLSRLCPLSEDSCYLAEEAINHCSGNGALFLALPWMTLGKMMTLCALVSYSVEGR